MDASFQDSVIRELHKDVQVAQVSAVLKCPTNGVVYRVAAWTKIQLQTSQPPSQHFVAKLGLEAFAVPSQKLLYLSNDTTL